MKRRSTIIITLSILACVLIVFLTAAILHEEGYIDASAIFGPRGASKKIGDMSDSYTIRGTIGTTPSPVPLPTATPFPHVRLTALPREMGIYEEGSGRAPSHEAEIGGDYYLFSFDWSNGTCAVTFNDSRSYGTFYEAEGIIYYTVNGETYTGHYEGTTFYTFYDGEHMICPPI